MNEFEKTYKKIIFECVENGLFNKILNVGNLFAPKNPFEITKENYVSGALYKGSDVYAGWVENILSDDEIILKVTGRYSKKMVPKFNNPDEYEMDGWNSFRGPATYVKYKLIPGESYYICDEECDGKPWETGEWMESIFELDDNIETEDGEGGAAVSASGTGGAGITTNSVFGCDGSAFDSLVHGQKDQNGPGITTHDIKAMYTLSLNPKTKKPKKDYPIFKRIKI